MVAVAPAYSRENILVGQASLRLAPWTPDTPPALPADTVAINGPWSPEWTPVGATEEGVTLAFSRSTEQIRIEEQATPVDERTTEVTMNVNTVLSEDTFTTMRISFGGGAITTVAATATDPGIRRLVISSELEQFSLGLEGQNEFGMWRRVRIPIVLSVADAEAAFRRAAAPRRWNVSFRSLVAPEEVEIVEAIAPPTGA